MPIPVPSLAFPFTHKHSSIENPPAPNTQIIMLAENHVVIHATVRKRLEPYPLRRTRPTPTAQP
jgi:hypothetical protein